MQTEKRACTVFVNDEFYKCAKGIVRIFESQQVSSLHDNFVIISKGSLVLRKLLIMYQNACSACDNLKITSPVGLTQFTLRGE